jgi:hypothetical protein
VHGAKICAGRRSATSRGSRFVGDQVRASGLVALDLLPHAVFDKRVTGSEVACKCLKI